MAAFFSVYVKNTVSPINNLEDIVESSNQVGVYGSSSEHSRQVNMKLTYRKIWQRIEAENTTAPSAPESSRWVWERNDFVFIDDGPILRHIANQPPCDLTVGRYWIHGLFCCMIRLSVSISNLTVLDPRFLWQVYSFQIFAKLFFVDFRTEGSTCLEIKLVSSSSDLQDCSGLGIGTFGEDTFPNG